MPVVPLPDVDTSTFEPLDLAPVLFNLPLLASLTKPRSATQGAVQLAAASLQRLWIASQAKFQFGIGGAWTALIWVYNDPAAQGTDRRFLTKGLAGSDLLVRISTGNQVVVTLGGGAGTATVTNDLITLAASGWYLVLVKFDPAASPNPLLSVTVGTAGSGLFTKTGDASGIGAYTPGTTDLSLGGTATGTQLLTGRLQDCAKWSRLTTSQEDAALFNNGFGLTHSEAAAVSGLLTNCQWWFPLHTLDGGGLLVDRISGTDTLTNVGSVAETGGVLIAPVSAEGDGISTVANEGTAGSILSVTSITTAGPVYRVDGIPCLDFTTDFLADGTDSALAFSTQFWLGLLIKDPVFTNGMELFGRWNGTTEGYAVTVSGSDILLRIRNITAATWYGGATYLTDGQWHWLDVVRRSDGTFTLYADGIARAHSVTTPLNATAGLQSYLGKARSAGTSLVAKVAGRFLRGVAPTRQERIQLSRWMEQYASIPALKSAGMAVPTFAHTGGSSFALAPTAQLAVAAGGETLWNKLNVYKLRNHPGNVSRVRFHTNTPTTNAWYVQVLQRNADGDATVLAQSEALYCTSPGLQIFELANPLPAPDGSHLAICVPDGATIGTVGASGNTIYSTAGVAAGRPTWASKSTNVVFAHFAEGSGVRVAGNGDSNFCGREGEFGDYWPHYQPGSGTGASTVPDPTANILRDCAARDPRLSVASYALGGQTTSWGISTGLPGLIAAFPTLDVYVIGLGSNDIYLNSTPAATVVANIETLITNARAAWPDVSIVVFGMYPFDLMTDTQAAIGREVDALLAPLCAGLTDVTFFPIRGRVGAIRPSTGYLDNYDPAKRRTDLLHVNRAGVIAIGTDLQPILSAKAFS